MVDFNILTVTNRVQNVVQKLLSDEDDPCRTNFGRRLPDQLSCDLLLAV